MRSIKRKRPAPLGFEGGGVAVETEECVSQAPLTAGRPATLPQAPGVAETDRTAADDRVTVDDPLSILPLDFYFLLFSPGQPEA